MTTETEVTTEGQVENNDDLDAFATDFFGEKKVDAEPAKPAAEQEEVETKTPEEAEAQKDADDEKDEAELKEEIPETPKRKTVQDRIDEVVRQREELRRESDAQLQQLRDEIAALKKPATDPAATTSEEAEPSPEALDKDGNPLYALGEFDPQYIRDLTRFTLNQERAKVQAETAESQRVAEQTKVQQELQTSWNGRVTAATEEYPDFVEKGQELLNGFNNLDPNYAGYLSNVLMNMDKGPDVLYYLSNHPEEAAAIVNSGAQKATLALGRIESRFLQSEQDAPKPKITKTPAPPVARTRGTAGAFVQVAPDTDDLDAFQSEFFRKA
jgi:hypothetical protein